MAAAYFAWVIPCSPFTDFARPRCAHFWRLAEEGIGDVRFDVQRLRSNFRSVQPLVEWINACFSRLMPQFDDRNRGAIAFRESEAADAIRYIGVRRCNSRDSPAAARNPQASQR